MSAGQWMESEVREQPGVLARNADRYLDELTTTFGGRTFGSVLLVARGSSDNAALYARYLIEVFLGIPVSLAAPSVLTRYGSHVRYRDCLAIGISQSGAAPDVSEVLAELRSQGHATLAVTNSPGSRITEAAETTLLLDAGEERSVAATKTYTCSLLALYQLVRALGGSLNAPALPDDAWGEECWEAAEGALGAVLRSSRWFALARGFSFCTALETSLKLMECALLPCKGYSSADFQHGPRALASHGAVALVYGEVPAGLEEAGCLVERAPDAGSGPDAPIREVVFGQWLALEAARARGLDPDQPANLEKVTQTY